MQSSNQKVPQGLLWPTKGGECTVCGKKGIGMRDGSDLEYDGIGVVHAGCCGDVVFTWSKSSASAHEQEIEVADQVQGGIIANKTYYAAAIKTKKGSVYDVHGVGMTKEAALRNARGMKKSELILHECTKAVYSRFKKYRVAFVYEDASAGNATDTTHGIYKWWNVPDGGEIG
jgi:hypothetical protein